MPRLALILDSRLPGEPLAYMTRYPSGEVEVRVVWVSLHVEPKKTRRRREAERLEAFREAFGGRLEAC